MTDLFSYAAARTARDCGMKRAVDAEDRHSPEKPWSDIAYSAIETIARRQIHVHIDHVLAADVPKPHSPNAWGAVWMKAIRNGIIQHSNQTKPCKSDKNKNAHRYPVYFSRIYDPRSNP